VFGNDGDEGERVGRDETPSSSSAFPCKREERLSVDGEIDERTGAGTSDGCGASLLDGWMLEGPSERRGWVRCTVLRRMYSTGPNHSTGFEKGRQLGTNYSVVLYSMYKAKAKAKARQG
jgi:hypothetical protein